MSWPTGKKVDPPGERKRRKRTERVYKIAGFLSTIEMNPSEEHPAHLVPIADQLLSLIEKGEL